MRPGSEAERRRAPRITLTTFCPTRCACKGKEFHALMVNVSELGARFEQDEPGHHIELAEGDMMSCVVKTPYGESQCRGKIAWTQRSEDRYMWGLEFLELSPSEKDPIRELLDSPF
jgi:hypothetical protein